MSRPYSCALQTVCIVAAAFCLQVGDEAALASARQALQEVKRWIGDREVELIVGEADAKCITADIDRRLSSTVRAIDINPTQRLSHAMQWFRFLFAHCSNTLVSRQCCSFVAEDFGCIANEDSGARSL